MLISGSEVRRPLWFIKDVLCTTVIRTLAPRVLSQGRISLQLLEGSLRGAKIVGGITIWGYACDQPRRINPLRSFTLPPQSSSQMLPPQRMGGAGQSSLCPRYCRRKNPIWGLPSRHLGPQTWWQQWLTPEGGDSFDDLPYWSFTCDLACSWAVTCGD